MQCTYRFNAQGVCPVNGARDTYDVSVCAPHEIQVEELLAISSRILSRPIFQEKYTQELAVALSATVHTQGRHTDVDTSCECVG